MLLSTLDDKYMALATFVLPTAVVGAGDGFSNNFHTNKWFIVGMMIYDMLQESIT